MAEEAQIEQNEEKETVFQLQKMDGFTTPIRIWFSAYINKFSDPITGFSKAHHVSPKDGLLSDPSKIVIFDDIWQKLALYMSQQAEFQFCKERVDQLDVCLKNKNLDKYIVMSLKMIDWLRNKYFRAGRIVADHYGMLPEAYTDFRDDSNEDDINKTFVEKPSIGQIFCIPPKYRSLSKDFEILKDKDQIFSMLDDVYTDVRLDLVWTNLN